MNSLASDVGCATRICAAVSALRSKVDHGTRPQALPARAALASILEDNSVVLGR